MPDVLIKNGTVVDGTGAPACKADVRVRDGFIAEVGPDLALQGERVRSGSAGVSINAEFLGAQQGRNWKVPLLIVDWREYTDWPIEDIRRELNITPIVGDQWDLTNRLCNESDPDYAQPVREAAE